MSLTLQLHSGASLTRDGGCDGQLILRIRQGETNVKSHMFLSMILAQIDAMESGASIEYSNALSARDSFVFCHDLLHKRAATMSGLDDMDFSSASPFGEQVYGMDFDLDFFLPSARFS